jgi:hypothetical protein
MTMTMMATAAAQATVGRHTDKWDNNNASTRMIPLIRQIDINKEGGMG